MGAVALVLLAIIVLPMVFDPEPRPVVPPVSVRIPGEDDTPFKPKHPVSKEQYVVPVGAYTNPESVTAKLALAKIPYYTEAAQGNLTRVRAGPFPNREAAAEVVAKLKGLGFEPGAVTTK